MATAKELRDKFLAMEAAKNALEDAQPKLTIGLGEGGGIYCQVNCNSDGVFIGRTGQSPVWLAERHALELKRVLNELYPD